MASAMRILRVAIVMSEAHSRGEARKAAAKCAQAAKQLRGNINQVTGAVPVAELCASKSHLRRGCRACSPGVSSRDRACGRARHSAAACRASDHGPARRVDQPPPHGQPAARQRYGTSLPEHPEPEHDPASAAQVLPVGHRLAPRAVAPRGNRRPPGGLGGVRGSILGAQISEIRGGHGRRGNASAVWPVGCATTGRQRSKPARVTPSQRGAQGNGQQE